MIKYIRYKSGNSISYGILDEDTIKEISSDPFDKYNLTGIQTKLSEVKIISPVSPSKIIAIGLNYNSHLDGRSAPEVPEAFYKVPTSLIGPEDSIIIPNEVLKQSLSIQPEAELAVVIGKSCRRVTKNNAMDYVLGFTCGNDVSVRPWQKNDLQWWRAKSSDTFAPIGPYIVSGLQHDNLGLQARINGKVVQDQNTSDLIHNVPSIIEFISSAITLNPGDVIMTGTPGSPGDIKSGDIVEVEIDGIGILKNYVKNEII